MAETDLSDLLPRIAVPTLLIWGQMDVRSPLSIASQFEETIPDTDLVVIEGAGHLSHLERPEQVSDAVRKFCPTHPPRAQVMPPSDGHPDVPLCPYWRQVRAVVRCDPHDRPVRACRLLIAKERGINEAPPLSSTRHVSPCQRTYGEVIAVETLG